MMREGNDHYKNLIKGFQHLTMISAKTHPMRKYRAYKKLIQIYEGRDKLDDESIEQTKPLETLKDSLRSITKLNIGCGSNYINGWLNIGLFPKTEIPFKTLAKIDGALVLNISLPAELPVTNESIKYIYASHFIEHLNFKEGKALLSHCYNLMQKGGVIRLTCPDMELWIQKYYENDMEFFKNYRSIFAHGIHPLVETKGEIFMSQVHNWGHKWNYDYDSLCHMLNLNGFDNIVRKTLLQSDIPEIEILEPSNEGRRLETMYVEATKPV